MTQEDDERYFAVLRDAFHEAPITQLVRQTMEVPTRGTVRITLHADPRQHHGAGRVHGGVLGLVLDNAGFFASASVTEGHWVTTTEYKINLLDSAADEDVVATGRVLRKGRHLIHAEMEATSAGGVKVAVGLGTYLVLPRKFRGVERSGGEH